MISSEVQRTLVKSPPELWAEISDPDALARHLGELGEVRITRSKPEELVEWESDTASGTISIKASGWGTRVTLTAARELPFAAEPEAEAEDVPDAEIVIETAPGDEAEAGTGAVPEDEVLAQAVAPAEPVAVPDAPTGEHAVAEPEQLGEPAPEPEIAVSVRPATPAGAMAAWAHQEAQGFSEPSAGEAVEELACVPELEEQPYAPQPRPAAPERRGFFARLFGRRSKQKPAPAAAASEASDADLRIAREAARRRLEATLAMPEAGTGVRQPSELPEEGPAGAEASGQDAEPSRDAPVDAPIEAPTVEFADGTAAEEPAVDGDAIEDGPAHAATEAWRGVERAEEPSVAPAAEAAAEPAVSDLAAELRAAEETAAEEVRAVLTAVLDRLGAAHHRPFSRG